MTKLVIVDYSVIMPTATMNISLPEALRDFVEEQVEERGYTSASEYMRELVRAAKSERELEEKLLSALDSEDLGEVGPEFFEMLKKQAKAASRKRGGGELPR